MNPIKFRRWRRCFSVSLLIFFVILTLVRCSAPRGRINDIPELQTMLPAGDPLIGASILLVGVGSDDEGALCNGVYIAKGAVLTAAHCLVSDLAYFVLVPISAERKNPLTRVKFLTVEATSFRHHEEYKINEREGMVRNDIAMVYFREPAQSLLKSIPILAAEQTVGLPKTLHWRSGEDSYFEGDSQQNQVLIAGYKVEKDQLLKGIFLIKDASSLIGFIKSNQSALVSLNPGTSIHQGVSGSGLFVQRGNQYHLIAITSHFFPGINLLAATHVPAYREWIESHRAPP